MRLLCRALDKGTSRPKYCKLASLITTQQASQASKNAAIWAPNQAGSRLGIVHEGLTPWTQEDEMLVQGAAPAGGVGVSPTPFLLPAKQRDSDAKPEHRTFKPMSKYLRTRGRRWAVHDYVHRRGLC